MNSSFDPTEIIQGVGILVFLVGLLIGLAIAVLIIYLVYNVFKRIPEEHRVMEPGLVWLLLIPCFNIVWNFFVYPRLADSLKNYFNSVDDESVGDCGKTLAWLYASFSAASIIPYLGVLLGLAALVIWIIFIVQAYGYKNRIVQGQGAGPGQMA